MGSKAEFQKAVDDYNAEVERLKGIITPLHDKQLALTTDDPKLPTKLDALKSEYADFKTQVNPSDAKIRELDKEMARQGNDYKETLATDDEKIEVQKIFKESQSSYRAIVPLAVKFTEEQKTKYQFIQDNPEKFGNASPEAATSTSTTQEQTRVSTEAAKLKTAASGATGAAAGAVGAAQAAVGNALGSLPGGIGNIAKGAVSIISGLQNAGAVVKVVKGITNSGGADPFDVKTFQLVKNGGGGPPYENILEQFASYSPIWTMSALTPSQFNNPATYRGKPAALKYVVFSSGGRFDSQRVRTEVGAPEYFVNNFEFITTAGASPAVGNSNVQTISFDLFEPYSMGFFLQSLAAAALEAGYTSYNECPFVLKLEFVGFKQDGSIYTGSDLLTKYFTVQLQDVSFTVTESGSQYKIKCHPYNHNGFSNVVANLTNDVALKIDGNPGEDTSKLMYVLSKGTNSLCAALNKIQDNLVETKQQLLADKYEIVFPVNWTDTVGMSASEVEEAGFASFIVSLADVPNPLGGAPSLSSEEFGEGEIGQAQLGFEATSGGNFNFGMAGDAVDPTTGVIQRDALTIDPKQRTFSFAQGTPIQQVISQLILSSEYAKRATDDKNLVNGMINWFRLDVQILLGAFDTIRGVRQRKFLYRVMPYKVHSSVFSNSNAAPPGMVELKKIVAKEYDYFYTGQNNSVLKFDIQINNLFHQMKLMTPPGQNDSVSNQDTNRSSEENPETADADQGGNAAMQGTTGSRPTKGNPQASKAPAKGGYGAKDVAELVATAMYNSITNNGSTNGDLVKVNFEIIGDPYWMVDQGMGNYLGEAAIDPTGQVSPESNQITADNTMNYQGSDAYVNIVFRTPIEPNLGVTGQGGLYSWPNKGAENPYSGLYKVIKVTNKFSDGLFRQTIEANRMPGQPGDFPDSYTPTFKNTFIYSDVKEGATKGSVVDSTANSSLDMRTQDEIQASIDLGNFEG